MPHTTDKSDINALPDPELNPLLNPLLAAHMGRWAEVYFTSPPEKRRQAVSELLRELQNGFFRESASVQVINDEKSEKNAEAEHAPDSPPSAAESLRICGVCATKNSGRQRFCGTCGAALQTSPEVHTPHVAEGERISAARWSKPEPSVGGNFPECAIEPALSRTAARGGHDDREAAWTLPGRSLPHFDVESEPVPYRYRLYAGAVLAVVLTLLLYMAWRRGTDVNSRAASTQSALSRTIPPAAPAASAQPSTTGSGSSEDNPPASPVRGENQTTATSRKHQPAGAPPPSPIVTMAASSSIIAAEQGGAEEVATAERYLNGTQGTPRDRGEAAQWLWRAVGKRNLAATTALSDLYLRGDGVPKSCDQARLLLDAAARKGGTAAAQRLRHLQAFGCE